MQILNGSQILNHSSKQPWFYYVRGRRN